MPDGAEQVTVRVVARIAEIPAPEWDACAGAENPFLGHAFLDALEESGSATRQSGWLPQHLAVDDAAGRLLGAAPLYLKSHSYGEYIFDHGWAAAYERAGGSYYPKLLSAVPFTPVTGPRLLVRPGAPEGTVEALIAAMIEVARQHEVSSLHVNFPAKPDLDRLVGAGFLQRTSRQFHWTNDGYESFDDFLASLTSRKRKSIKKERREAVADGTVVHTLTGAEIETRHWDAFFRVYRATGSRKWGSPYLTRSFFDLIGRRMAEKIVLVMAERQGKFVAGALNFIGADTLYGRNWGCLGHERFLHFEACYYRAIEFAIARGLKRVEAGAQGEHKIQRGYLPTPTWSAHWIPDPSFRRAIEDFLRRERLAIRREIEELNDYSPFRHEDEEQE